MTKLRFVQLAAGLGLVVSPAYAEQPETGTRLAAPQSRNTGSVAMTDRDQAVGAKRMAECVYNRKTALARQALTASTKVVQDAAMNKIMGEVQCFGAEFSNELVGMRVVNIPPQIMRGMLAEAAFKRLDDEAKKLQALPLQQIYQRDWFAVTGRHITVDEMGACIADTNPAGILALSRTAPTSKEENAAFGGLMGDLGKCLRAGTKLQAGRQALRAALADALYQRLHAPASVAAPAPVAEATKK